jgi:hypothetical protein
LPSDWYGKRSGKPGKKNSGNGKKIPATGSTGKKIDFGHTDMIFRTFLDQAKKKENGSQTKPFSQRNYGRFKQ